MTENAVRTAPPTAFRHLYPRGRAQNQRPTELDSTADRLPYNNTHHRVVNHVYALKHDVFGMLSEELKYVFYVRFVRQSTQAYAVFSRAARDDVLRQRQQWYVPEKGGRRVVHAGRRGHRRRDVAVAIAGRRPDRRIHGAVQNL